MLNLARLGHCLHLGLARDGLSLARTHRWGDPAFTLLAEQALAPGACEDAGALDAALAQLCAGHDLRGQRLRVVLADELVRLWSVTPPQGAARLADLEAACALRFQGLYGDSLAGWELAADWQADAPFLACALRASLGDSLARAARDSGALLTQVQPQLLAAWNRWCGKLDAAAWFALVQGDRLSLGISRARRLHAVRVLRVTPEASLDWLAQQVAREALRLECAAPELLQVCGAAPAQWVDGSHATLRVQRLDHARRGLPPLSAAAQLSYSGVGA
ncbi:hypothetical protein [Massilia sp. TS11]|uniref:hypothetical protein n=1 Tax=Massilia sp. TS11 TaxID=2908003 RepID=UPI001EDC1A5F|nr:hypothetical protein [Massilia sp. TS11]MCG2586557.1 hypothetical protein [Massilia sp. TS11]